MMDDVQWVVSLKSSSREMSVLRSTYVTYIPPLLFICSLLYVLCYKIYRLLSKPDDSPSPQDEDADYVSNSGKTWLKETLDAYDGPIIVAFRAIRLICCVVLVYLQLQDPLDIYSDITDSLMFFFYVSDCIVLPVCFR